MIKLAFRDSCSYEVDNIPPVKIDAPNVNVAILKLAMEHDLSKFNAIYITNSDDEDEED